MEAKQPARKLVKYMKREQLLFTSYVWNDADRDLFDEYIPGTNIKDMCFIRNNIGIAEVYFGEIELPAFNRKIAAAITNTPQILDRMIFDFKYHWEKFWPYISGQKHIETPHEFKDYHDNFFKWWAPMAFIFELPDQDIPDELRKKALKVREESQEYSDAYDRVIKDYINRRFPQYNSIVFAITPNEMSRLATLTPDEVTAITTRAKGCALLTANGVTTLLLLDELDKALETAGIVLDKPKIEITDYVKGTPASLGKVRGRIRLVLTKAGTKDVKGGEVMVCSMTSPDYVPAMKKCAAVVTDEGGIVCHAAIVCRELGIPCVTGTKIATSALRDGDLVEVDAEKGIVKIIERQ